MRKNVYLLPVCAFLSEMIGCERVMNVVVMLVSIIRKIAKILSILLYLFALFFVFLYNISE